MKKNSTTKTDETPLARRLRLVKRIVQNDPDTAEHLFELLVLTKPETETPVEEAIHSDVLRELYSLTPECWEGFREKESLLNRGRGAQ